MPESKKWVRNGEGGVDRAVSVGKLGPAKQEDLAPGERMETGVGVTRGS